MEAHVEAALPIFTMRKATMTLIEKCAAQCAHREISRNIKLRTQRGAHLLIGGWLIHAAPLLLRDKEEAVAAFEAHTQ